MAGYCLDGFALSPAGEAAFEKAGSVAMQDVSRVHDFGDHRLYLSSVLPTSDLEVLQHYHIAHVVIAAEKMQLPHPAVVRYYCIDIPDNELANMLEALPGAIQFIDEALTRGSVLVHCQAGVSRSATVVTAYLMHNMGLAADEAIARVRRARPMIHPNAGFLRQLEASEAMGCQVDCESDHYKAWEATLRTPEAEAKRMQIEERDMWAKLRPGPPQTAEAQRAAMEKRLAAIQGWGTANPSKQTLGPRSKSTKEKEEKNLGEQE